MNKEKKNLKPLWQKKCFGCGTEETKHFLQDCEDCCGLPCWHYEGKLLENGWTDMLQKANPDQPYCCDCWIKKDPGRHEVFVKSSQECSPTFHSTKFANVSNKELITEFRKRLTEGELRLMKPILTRTLGKNEPYLPFDGVVFVKDKEEITALYNYSNPMKKKKE